MASLHSRWAGAHEGKQNQLVNFFPSVLFKKGIAKSRQTHSQITPDQPGFKNSLGKTARCPSHLAALSPAGADSPLVRNVVSRESGNWQPSFWSFVRECGKILGIHGRNLLLGFGWAEPVLLGKQRPARFIMT
jgi:hypothetical protein